MWQANSCLRQALARVDRQWCMCRWMGPHSCKNCLRGRIMASASKEGMNGKANHSDAVQNGRDDEVDGAPCKCRNLRGREGLISCVFPISKPSWSLSKIEIIFLKKLVLDLRVKCWKYFIPRFHLTFAKEKMLMVSSMNTRDCVIFVIKQYSFIFLGSALLHRLKSKLFSTQSVNPKDYEYKR